MSQGSQKDYSQNNTSQHHNMDYNESFKMKSYSPDYISSNVFNHNLGGENRRSYMRDEVAIDNNQYDSNVDNNYEYNNNDVEIFEDKENHIEEMAMEEEPEIEEEQDI
jgi:hypothetical protein